MTFSELVLAVQSRLNLTSTESATRIGVTLNDRYKRVTSAIGINLSRRTTVQANVTVGVSTLNFAACEKIINVVDRSATPYRVLDEATVEQLRAEQPSSNATPRKYAILAVDAHSVTILLDCVPQSAFTLYADCYGRASTLSGSQEPAFEEDFHDVLLHGALADEYRKMEKPAYARESESLYQERLSDLRMFRTKSSYLDIMQGGNTRRSLGVSGGSGGSGSSTNGAASYTQTGLITFDRTSAAPGSRYPFAVAVGSEKVANLDADLLDGLDSLAFVIIATDQTITGLKTFNRGAAVPFAVDAASLAVANLNAAKCAGIAEAETVTGAWAFNRSPSAPFTVNAGSAVVTNLDADKVDGLEAAALAQLAAANTLTNATPLILSNASGGVRERGRSFQMGEWQTRAFAAGNYVAVGGGNTWVVASGDVLIEQYTLIGKALLFVFDYFTTTITGTPTQIMTVVPGAFSAAAAAINPIRISDGGGTHIGVASVSGTTLTFLLDSTFTAAFTAGADNVRVHGQIMFPVS
jgi:hypothetical protein